MTATGIWTTEGIKTDTLVFSKKFKIYRGKCSEDVSCVKNQKCYGVLFYERNRGGNEYFSLTENEYLSLVDGIEGKISDIIAPLLSLEWARVVVDMMEEGLFPASFSSWQDIEKEIRRRGYDGITLCPFYMPDTVGFYVMEKGTHYTTAQIEEFAATEGWIESFLTYKGYKWIPEKTTWRNPQGSLWDEENQNWLIDTA
jgi:hypothetical protein